MVTLLGLDVNIILVIAGSCFVAWRLFHWLEKKPTKPKIYDSTKEIKKKNMRVMQYNKVKKKLMKGNKTWFKIFGEMRYLIKIPIVKEEIILKDGSKEITTEESIFNLIRLGVKTKSLLGLYWYANRQLVMNGQLLRRKVWHPDGTTEEVMNEDERHIYLPSNIQVDELKDSIYIYSTEDQTSGLISFINSQVHELQNKLIADASSSQMITLSTIPVEHAFNVRAEKEKQETFKQQAEFSKESE